MPRKRRHRLFRVAAAGFAAVVAAIAVDAGTHASADVTNPFPSPSPVASTGPASGGYASLGFSSLAARGGQIPAASGTATPAAFNAIRASGYSIDAFSRISGTYGARIRYRDESFHGDDNAIGSVFDMSAFYTGGTRLAVGVGIASLQRSTDNTSSNGFGVSIAEIPDFTKRVSTYASIDVYPSLPAPGGKRGALDLIGAGLAFSNRGSSQTFERIGISDQIFSPVTTSPQTLFGVEVGVGATF